MTHYAGALRRALPNDGKNWMWLDVAVPFGGRIVECGAADDVRERPQAAETRAFLGMGE